MSPGELTKDVILSTSWFAGGLLLYLAWFHFHEHGPFWWAWSLTRGCMAVLVLLISEAVFGAAEVPLTWRSALYAVASIGLVVGLVGVISDVRRRRKGESHDRNHP